MTTISDKDRAEALAMSEAFVGREALGALNDNGVRRWLAVRDHVLAAHECPSLPVWRPVTADEIEPGWEVRTRRHNDSEVAWGVAHHRDGDGDWLTQADVALTWDDMGWTYETTAPAPAPDPRIAVVMEWFCSTTADYGAIADLLARLDNLEEGEQS